VAKVGGMTVAGHVELCLSLAFCLHCADPPRVTQPPDAPVAVEVEVVSLRTVPMGPTYVATLEPSVGATLSSPTGGRVDRVLVTLGQPVRSGDALLTLRAEDAELARASASLALRQAEAVLAGARHDEETPEVTSARSTMEAAEDALQRAESVAARGAVAELELSRLRHEATAARAAWTAARAGASVARARAEQARVELRQTGVALEESVIRAPFDGVVAAVIVQRGDVLGPGTPALRVLDPRGLRLSFDVPPEELSAVVEGSVVSSERGLEARVSRIAPEVDPLTRAVRVEAEVLRTSGLPLGSRVGIRVQQRSQEVAVLPLPSVRTFAGVSRAFFVVDDHVEERLLEVLRELPDGLAVRNASPGERVVRSPSPEVTDGRAVTP
jgi:HlyD family secretion protein